MGKSLLENVREGMTAPGEAFAFRTKLPEARWQVRPPPGSLVPGEMRRGMDGENAAKLMRRVADLEAEPTELYRADERKIDALTAQRDAWTGIAVRYKEQIVALEAENLALKAQIAAFTAANVAKPADARKPMPANALAGRRDDPRRIGS